jgi:hypothetical protein
MGGHYSKKKKVGNRNITSVDGEFVLQNSIFLRMLILPIQRLHLPSNGDPLYIYKYIYTW